MATGDFITQVGAKDLTPTNGIFNEVPLVMPTATGVGIAGAPCNKLSNQAYQFQARVPLNGTPLSTGLTCVITVVDDPRNPGAGLVGKFGITIKRLNGGADYTQTNASTEVTGNVTMSSTTGNESTLSLAVTKAAISASLAAGDSVLVQIRRLGTDAADTHPGVILLTGAVLQDT
jgi:hypothetical protein